MIKSIRVFAYSFLANFKRRLSDLIKINDEINIKKIKIEEILFFILLFLIIIL